jgi:hypothetical protein
MVYLSRKIENCLRYIFGCWMGLSAKGWPNDVSSDFIKAFSIKRLSFASKASFKNSITLFRLKLGVCRVLT